MGVGTVVKNVALWPVHLLRVVTWPVRATIKHAMAPLIGYRELSEDQKTTYEAGKKAHGRKRSELNSEKQDKRATEETLSETEAKLRKAETARTKSKEAHDRHGGPLTSATTAHTQATADLAEAQRNQRAADLAVTDAKLPGSGVDAAEVTRLEAVATTHAAEVTRHTQSVATHHERMTKLQAQLGGHRPVADLETEIADHKTAIDELKTKIKDVHTPEISKLEGELSGLVKGAKKPPLRYHPTEKTFFGNRPLVAVINENRGKSAGIAAAVLIIPTAIGYARSWFKKHDAQKQADEVQNQLDTELAKEQTIIGTMRQGLGSPDINYRQDWAQRTAAGKGAGVGGPG